MKDFEASGGRMMIKGEPQRVVTNGPKRPDRPFNRERGVCVADTMSLGYNDVDTDPTVIVVTVCICMLVFAYTCLNVIDVTYKRICNYRV